MKRSQPGHNGRMSSSISASRLFGARIEQLAGISRVRHQAGSSGIAGYVERKARPAFEAYAADQHEIVLAAFMSAVSGLAWEACRALLDERVPGATEEQQRLFKEDRRGKCEREHVCCAAILATKGPSIKTAK